MLGSMIEDVIKGYSEVSDEWIERSERISNSDLFKHVIDLLPDPPSRIADIGAGTGRDAGWFANMGHHVTAVEPTARLRLAGTALHRSANIRWVDDRLPDLRALPEHVRFDCILLNGVWQHLDHDQRSAAISRLTDLVDTGGLLVLSLRHGPGAAGRPVFPIDVDDTLEAATSAGFRVERCCVADSIQAANCAAGVHWTWLALRRN